jgi:hypothetical protein
MFGVSPPAPWWRGRTDVKASAQTGCRSYVRSAQVTLSGIVAWARTMVRSIRGLLRPRCPFVLTRRGQVRLGAFRPGLGQTGGMIFPTAYLDKAPAAGWGSWWVEVTAVRTFCQGVHTSSVASRRFAASLTRQLAQAGRNGARRRHDRVEQSEERPQT